jgi:NAD(P)-dependent dehydrogenase (short-subunit alcohol dehydrogenase family)
MRIEGSACIVTGGASGLGEATVRMLRMRGADVLIADLNHADGTALAQETGALFCNTDVTAEEAAQRAVDLAVERFGRLGAVINCAGVGPAHKLLDKNGPHRLDTFRRAVDINLIGSFNMLRLSAEAMAKQPASVDGERGAIVNVASVAAFDGQIGQCAYAASKAALVGMTLPAARELARYGIRVVAIAPGIFETPLLASLPEEVRMSLGKMAPFPARLGRPSEFSGLVCHALENAMLNGEVIRLDGALRMAAR